MIIMNTGNTGRAINSIGDAVQHCHEKAKMLKDRAGKWKHTSEHCDTELVRNKAIEEIDRCLDCAADHEQLAEWLEELKERREADRWIPVSERLPEKEGRCLVQTDFGDVCMDSFIDGMFVCYLGNVTHWRPLPEPYKESEANT